MENQELADGIRNPDGKELGLETGGTALVETEAASIEVEVSDRPYRGMVTLPHGFGEVKDRTLR